MRFSHSNPHSFCPYHHLQFPISLIHISTFDSASLSSASFFLTLSSTSPLFRPHPCHPLHHSHLVLSLFRIPFTGQRPLLDQSRARPLLLCRHFQPPRLPSRALAGSLAHSAGGACRHPTSLSTSFSTKTNPVSSNSSNSCTRRLRRPRIMNCFIKGGIGTLRRQIFAQFSLSFRSKSFAKTVHFSIAGHLPMRSRAGCHVPSQLVHSPHSSLPSLRLPFVDCGVYVPSHHPDRVRTHLFQEIPDHQPD